MKGNLRYYLRMNADSGAVVQPLPAEQVALAVEVFRMLADGTRVQILWALVDGERAVNELAEAIGKPGPSVSQHLAKLEWRDWSEPGETEIKSSTNWRTTTSSG